MRKSRLASLAKSNMLRARLPCHCSEGGLCKGVEFLKLAGRSPEDLRLKNAAERDDNKLDSMLRSKRSSKTPSRKGGRAAPLTPSTQKFLNFTPVKSKNGTSSIGDAPSGMCMYVHIYLCVCACMYVNKHIHV